MARRYKRDSKGRFAGSGTFRAGSRAADKGKDARSNASLMRTLSKGEKEGGKIDARNARIAGRSRGASTGTDAKLIGRAERSFAQKANQSKVKQRKMERERKSFTRKGAMRSGR